MEIVGEVVDHGGGAAVRQLLVVFVGADGVGVALGAEPVANQRPIAHCLAETVEDADSLRCETGRSGRELHRQADRGLRRRRRDLSRRGWSDVEGRGSLPMGRSASAT